MFARRRWNRGICRASGQPWYRVGKRFWRGSSLTFETHKFEDGCGNTLSIEAPSKILDEYAANRSPVILAKEKVAEEQREKERMELKLKHEAYWEEQRRNPPKPITFWKEWGWLFIQGGLLLTLYLLKKFWLEK